MTAMHKEKNNYSKMATSVIDFNQGGIWSDVPSPYRPSRPATTSPSFFPYRSLNSYNQKVPCTKTRKQIESFWPGRTYFSLPSTPPKYDLSIEKYLEVSEDRRFGIQRNENGKCTGKLPYVDKNKNKCLPEWYIEPCIDVLNMPFSEKGIVSSPVVAPLDHSQKREPYLPDSSYDDDCDFSDESQYFDFEDCSSVNPSSGEISKLNSLGQGQSRFLSLFKSKDGSSSSCSSSTSSLSERQEEQNFKDSNDNSIISASEDAVSDENSYESEIATGIEAVRKGLARLLSIPTDNLESTQQLRHDFVDETVSLQNESIHHEKETQIEPIPNSGSRLLKLFPSAVFQTEDSVWPHESPLCISSLWSSESSSASGLVNNNNYPSEHSSMKNSPTNVSPTKDSSSPVNVKVPNIASISPTAPLHFNTTPSSCSVEGFPIQSDLPVNLTANTSYYTACDLSNEETEIEAALERGEGFFMNDDPQSKERSSDIEIPPVDDAIWSPTLSCIHNKPVDDVLKLENVSPMTLKKIAEDAANDIMDWLDVWLSRCANPKCHDSVKDDYQLLRTDEHQPSRNDEEVDTQDFQQNIQNASLNFYRMFDSNADDFTFHKLLHLAEEDEMSSEENIFAHLAQSPGILDFLIEKNDKEEETEMHKQFSGPSLHFLLNSRSSDIYDSYLLFPDLVQFTNPYKNYTTSECKGLDESDILSQILSSSFDWMNTYDTLDSAQRNKWDHTLQSLSPKTPFTPTGNLSENLNAFERKHSITLEDLCNLTTAATSIESRMDHSSFVSPELFLQYIQSQLGCFENIAFFDSPSLKNEFFQETTHQIHLNDEYLKLYRPIPMFPLQFINRLSLTDGKSSFLDENNSESLLFSPKTHFRPITPKTEENLEEECTEYTEVDRCKMETPDDIDEELVAIHEGADHSKLVEIYAQMQLKQQLAAEQKLNYPQLVVVDENGVTDEENAYEEKHTSYNANEIDVNDYALDCAAEAAATAAVNALGSADPEEALAILEEWHWKDNLQDETEITQTLPHFGYFESNSCQNFLTSCNDFSAENKPVAPTLEYPFENLSATTRWSVDDGSSNDQNFKYDDIKNIWIAGTETTISNEENNSNYLHSNTVEQNPSDENHANERCQLFLEDVKNQLLYLDTSEQNPGSSWCHMTEREEVVDQPIDKTQGNSLSYPFKDNFDNELKVSCKVNLVNQADDDVEEYPDYVKEEHYEEFGPMELSSNDQFLINPIYETDNPG